MSSRFFLFVVGLVILWKIAIIAASYGLAGLMPLQEPLTAIRDIKFTQFGLDLPYGLWVWGNLDGFYYMAVAQQEGYLHGQQPFFPLFPAAMWVVRKLTGLPLLIAGQLVSLAALVAALFVIRKLLVLDRLASLVPLVFLIVLSWPTSFYYGAVYNDSLFFFLATLSIYWGRQKRWLAASLAGAFATLTRLNGLALFWYLIVEYLTAVKIANWKPFFSFLLIPGAFAGYLSYVQYKFGSWYALFDAMKVWEQDKPVFPLQVFWRYFKILITADPAKLNYWVAVGELGFVLFLIALLIYAYKKIRPSYWVFFFVSVLIPTITGTFAGFPRYGLHLFPMYLTICLLLISRHWLIKLACFTISFILFLAYMTLFTRGYFAT